MSGMHWQGQWDPFREFRREVGRLLGNFDALGVRLPRPFPAINLYDAGDRYLLTAELPGIDPKEIDLSITSGTLTLRGERRRPSGINEESYRRQERRFGRWTRTVTLPDRVDASKIVAQFALGILTVTIPKDADARPRQIAVSTDAN